MFSLHPVSKGNRAINVRWITRGKLAMALLALVATSCAEPTTTRVASAPQFVMEPRVHAQIAAGVEERAWIIEYHAQAMDEVMKWAKKHKGASKPEKCAMLFDLGIKYTAKARAAGKVRTTPHEDSVGMAQVTQSQRLCSPTPAMSIFPGLPTLPRLSFASVDEDAFSSYANRMTKGFYLSNGSPEAVNTVLVNILNEAANGGLITADELSGLLTHANFIVSSDSTWTAEQQTGAFGDDQMYVPPYSIFRGFNQLWIAWDLFVAAKIWWDWCGSTCRSIGAQDASGLLIGYKSTHDWTAAFWNALGNSTAAAIEAAM